MKKETSRKQVRKKIKSVKLADKNPIKSDVQGSYTGVPDEPYERPVQDADDL